MANPMPYIAYQFTDSDLKTIHSFMELSPFGPPTAYRWFKGLGIKAEIKTGDVEDFACAFYSQYNKTYGRTY